MSAPGSATARAAAAEPPGPPVALGPLVPAAEGDPAGRGPGTASRRASGASCQWMSPRPVVARPPAGHRALWPPGAGRPCGGRRRRSGRCGVSIEVERVDARLLAVEELPGALRGVGQRPDCRRRAGSPVAGPVESGRGGASRRGSPRGGSPAGSASAPGPHSSSRWTRARSQRSGSSPTFRRTRSRTGSVANSA